MSPSANSPKETAAVLATQKQWLESQRGGITAALEKSGGRIYGKCGAAELLGLAISYVFATRNHRLLSRLGLDRKSHRRNSPMPRPERC